MNFDPDLVRALREVHYFLLMAELPQEIPPAALKVGSLLLHLAQLTKQNWIALECSTYHKDWASFRCVGQKSCNAGEANGQKCTALAIKQSCHLLQGCVMPMPALDLRAILQIASSSTRGFKTHRTVHTTTLVRRL